MNPKPLAQDVQQTESSSLKFVPARWWQMISFLRLNFKVVQGHDPLADRILARPWSPFSVMTFGFMMDSFFRSSPYFLYIEEKRVGLLWLRTRSRFVYGLSLGFLPNFQKKGLGSQAMNFIEEYTRRQAQNTIVASIAAENEPPQRLVRAFGYRSLGLDTVNLTLTTDHLDTPTAKVEVEQLSRQAAKDRWRWWRLYEVERVAGREAVEPASSLLDEPPKGEYLALYQASPHYEEIGIAATRPSSNGGLAVSLFTAPTFWTGSHIGELLNIISRRLEAPIHQLTLSRKHLSALGESAPFGFEHDTRQERYLMFKQLEP